MVKKMRVKVICILIFLLLISSCLVHFSVDGKKVEINPYSVKSKVIINQDEYLKNKEIYEEDKPIKIPSNVYAFPTITNANVLGNELEYSPPWSSNWKDNDYQIEGIKGITADAWGENTETTGYYGKTRIQTWAVMAGWTWIKVWLCHGFYFTPSTTSTYTFNFDYSIEGEVNGDSPGYHQGSAANSKVTLLYVVDFGNYDSDLIVDEWTVFSSPSYSENFDKSITHSMTAELEEGERYWIGVQSVLKNWCEGFGASGAFTDSKTKGDHARLEKVKIQWDDGIDISINPSSYDYGDVKVTNSYKDKKFVVKNTGSRTAHDVTVFAENYGDEIPGFSIIDIDYEIGNLYPGDSIELTIRFNPWGPGVHEGALLVEGSFGEVKASLTGYGDDCSFPSMTKISMTDRTCKTLSILESMIKFFHMALEDIDLLH